MRGVGTDGRDTLAPSLYHRRRVPPISALLLRFFRQREAGVQPDVVTCNSLLGALASGRGPSQALRLLEDPSEREGGGLDLCCGAGGAGPRPLLRGWGGAACLAPCGFPALPLGADRCRAPERRLVSGPLSPPEDMWRRRVEVRKTSCRLAVQVTWIRSTCPPLAVACYLLVQRCGPGKPKRS